MYILALFLQTSCVSTKGDGAIVLHSKEVQRVDKAPIRELLPKFVAEMLVEWKKGIK